MPRLQWPFRASATMRRTRRQIRISPRYGGYCSRYGRSQSIIDKRGPRRAKRGHSLAAGYRPPAVSYPSCASPVAQAACVSEKLKLSVLKSLHPRVRDTSKRESAGKKKKSYLSRALIITNNSSSFRFVTFSPAPNFSLEFCRTSRQAVSYRYAIHVNFV